MQIIAHISILGPASRQITLRDDKLTASRPLLRVVGKQLHPILLDTFSVHRTLILGISERAAIADVRASAASSAPSAGPWQSWLLAAVEPNR